MNLFKIIKNLYYSKTIEDQTKLWMICDFIVRVLECPGVNIFQVKRNLRNILEGFINDDNVNSESFKGCIRGLMRFL